MAVPPVPQARTAAPVRAVRVPLLVDVVIGLLTLVALPLALVAIPNTISVVAALLPPGVSQVDMIRAHGLALPAMLVTVPLAAVAVRRFRAAPILVAGLTLLALADVAGGYTDTVTLVGVLRVLHGIGAGMLVPATLVAVAERPRRRVLLPIWAGTLAASLLTAQALALWAIRDVTSWQVTLQPYPLLTGVALALAAAYLVLWMVSGDGGTRAEGEILPAGRPTSAERGRLALAIVPAVAIAVLGVGITFDWPPRLVVIAAAVVVAAMLALAALGAFEGPGGRTLAFVNVAVGLVVLPTSAQMTYIELGGPLGGPGLRGLWVPFLVAALTSLAGALLAGRAPETFAARLAVLGLAAVVVGLAAIRLLVPAPSGTPLVVPFVLIATGSAVALVGAFRTAGLGSAMLGLSLCFPAVLAGFLLGTGIQVNRLRDAAETAGGNGDALVEGFIDALHMWALVGGFVVVGVIVLSSVLARRAAAASAGGPVVIPAPTPSPEEDDDTPGDAGPAR
ncbi:hypothetical protein GCM10010116_08780 [Microbispora rosea subsp. aerata]|nr:hypothetical protein [Microbispora rosea]GGO04442.1 hypothetical protein GCM10010116_08780 [Microbispora rosea subsp. aerata]GIH55008.1 hypothetical protein Mro02_19220 [Microbispora rosea subsp. aerata]GLJ87261.1 hypothetical protein GCM10017588_60060 [Microbispora rosea subsp. aerata]